MSHKPHAKLPDIVDINQTDAGFAADVIRRSGEAHHFAPVEALGTISRQDGWIDAHIQAILDLELVDREAVAQAGFKVAVDAVHSTGGIAVPRLGHRHLPLDLEVTSKDGKRHARYLNCGD